MKPTTKFSQPQLNPANKPHSNQATLKPSHTQSKLREQSDESHTQSKPHIHKLLWNPFFTVGERDTPNSLYKFNFLYKNFNEIYKITLVIK